MYTTDNIGYYYYVIIITLLRLTTVRDQVVLAVRQEYVTLGDQRVFLRDGDEVAVIPPLSGG